MKDQSNKLAALSKAFLSYFYVGYIPKAPGTFGSLATIPLILFLSFLHINIWHLGSLITLLILAAGISAEYIQQLQKRP